MKTPLDERKEEESDGKMAQEPTFDELVSEWYTRTKAMIDRKEDVLEQTDIRGISFKELYERGEKPPYEVNSVDEREIRSMAGSIGDKNPLYWDPSYAEKTRYHSLIAPQTITMRLLNVTLHGARLEKRTEKNRVYPLANYFSGVLFNWFDVIMPETRVFIELKYAEILEKKGKVAGRMFILCSNGRFWDQRKRLFCTARGHLIMVPMPSRSNVEQIGANMLYERPPQAYKPEEIEKIAHDIDSEVRRGAEPRYWEDVNIGDRLTPVVKGPFTEQDQAIDPREGFEIPYWENKGGDREGRTHPVTRWPWSAAAEHEDYLLCRYRGLPGPFDGGPTRCTYPAHLLMNWGGDGCFIRREYFEVRFPKYSTDTTWFNGEVVRKYKVVEKGEKGTEGWEAGGVGGEAEYAAVDIRVAGTNQIGEKSIQGIATLYLPSHELGEVKLPVPHLPKPAYMPFPRYSDDVPDYRNVPSAI